MNWKTVLFLPPIALAIGGYMYLNNAPETEVAAPAEAELAVRAITVQPQSLTPTATGFGRVEAARTFSAIAEAQGRVTTLAEGLAEGTVVMADSILVEIDRTDYTLTLGKTEANIAAANAQLAELARQEVNTRASLDIETRTLEVTQAEYDRIAALVDSGTSTRAALDTVQKTLLAQEKAVLALENTLALYPAQKQSVEATLAVRTAELAEAERQLSKTTIRAPFDARITASNVQVDQFVRVGEVLVTLESVDAAEITAEVQPTDFEPLVRLMFEDRDVGDLQIDTANAVRLLTLAGLTAQVTVSDRSYDITWPAEIQRYRGSTDSDTGTIGFVVRVEHPNLADPGNRRPPLNVGSFVAVEFSAPPRTGVIAVPRNALRRDDTGGSFVFLVDAESRLARRDVTLGPAVDGQVVIEDGLNAGDVVVLSSPQPAVLGVKLITVMGD